MFHIEYNEVLAILGVMERTLDEMNDSLETFAVATATYNANMQDATATEATNIVLSLRSEIVSMKELIEQSNRKLREGTVGLKQIEDRVSDGGLQV
ncbi:MAG: hypothetical protein E7590_06680 [Ruminococcaceae bacterium]|nr:hypothetical protein [Oscillospiraceae bacterium]